VAGNANRVLLLDYDGTLAPFRIERDQAVPYPGVRQILETILAEGACRLVIVTGRWTRDLLPLLGLDMMPEVWGSHGIERLHADGTHEVLPLSDAVREGLDKARAWADQGGYGDRCEEKPGCLALHWRGLGEEETRALRRATEPVWGDISRRFDLGLHEFDGGLELRAFGRNKGDAVTTILAEMGDDALGVYLGDDLTDEDAFAAVAGSGWGVLVRDVCRPSMADLWVRPPEELLEFLETWHLTCRRTVKA